MKNNQKLHNMDNNLTEEQKASIDKQLEQLAQGLEKWMLVGAAIFIGLQIIRAIIL